jgi:hypothetical protein
MLNQVKNLKLTTMKRLVFVMLLIAGTLVATTSNAQVYIRGRMGFGFHPRVYCPPPVVYQEQYPAAPYYNEYDNNRVIVTVPGYGYDRYNNRFDRYEDRENYHRGYYHDRREDWHEHRGEGRHRW